MVATLKTPDLIQYTVGPHQQGIRLDLFLKHSYPHRSRKNLQKAILSGSIALFRVKPHLTTSKLKPSTCLMSGDQIQIRYHRPQEPQVCFDYQVIYEDSSILVINKPAPLPVHPAGCYFFNTLLTHLKSARQQELYLVHRLDKETSGLIVLAQTPSACRHLTHQFAQRIPKKQYLAIVHGLCPSDFTVSQALKRSTQSCIGLKMTTTSELEGQAAFTEFQRIDVTSKKQSTYSLVQCRPQTGRQHQIRVHLESAGFPIVGDKLYGRPESEALAFFNREPLNQAILEALPLPRHALHAASIQFLHPKHEKPLQLDVPLPEDLRYFFYES